MYLKYCSAWRVDMRSVHADGGVSLLCQVYRNPYNYGRLNNWKVFLGVEKRRCASILFGIFMLLCSFGYFTNLASFVFSHWVSRVLLPSGHTPHGDGRTWDVFPAKKDLISVWHTPLRQTCNPGWCETTLVVYFRLTFRIQAQRLQ